MEVIRASQRLDRVTHEGSCCLKCSENIGLPNEDSGELNTGVPKTQHGTRQVTGCGRQHGIRQVTGCGWRMEPPLEVESPPVGPTSLFNKELPKEPDTH